MVLVIDYQKDPSGASRYVEAFNAYASLPVAKQHARTCLKTLGYDPIEFIEYEEQNDIETWRHGDGVLAYAKASAGPVFRVRIDTTPNIKGIKSRKDGAVDDKLSYVLQTIIQYIVDRVGAKATTVVERVFATTKDGG